MRLGDIMSTPVFTISQRAGVAEAEATMREKGVRHLVVLDGRDVAGVLSRRDLGEAGRGEGVAGAMSRTVVTASPRTTVREAANLLRGHTVGCLPVMDKGRLVGMVTISDLLTLLGQGVERPVPRSTRWTLKGRGPRRKAVQADRPPLRA